MAAHLHAFVNANVSAVALDHVSVSAVEYSGLERLLRHH